MLIAYYFCIIVCFCISCIAPCRSRLMFMYMLGHVQMVSVSEVQEEQVPEVLEGLQVISCRDTNIAFEQGKPQCIPPHSLTFPFELLYLC
jgi:hypothetical protein